MRMRFDPEDSSGFEHARTALLDRFRTWLATSSPIDDVEGLHFAASCAIDWKFRRDGALGRWRTRYIREFLLEWCPRSLDVEADDSAPIAAGLATLMMFLGDEGLLEHSDPPEKLSMSAAELLPEFVEAMADERRFSWGKTMVTRARASGVDLSDQAEMDRFIAGFNALPEEERHRILPDPPGGFPEPDDGGVPLPPVALPGEEVEAASRAAAPILTMFSKLAEFVGAGRKLTQKGNLTLADARKLVELLDTGDELDRTIGDRVYKTRSAEDLYWLRLVFVWAKKAGMLRVQHSKVIATKRGLSLGADRGAGFDRAVDALFALGVLTGQRVSSRWGWHEVDALIDGMVIELLAVPYAVQGPVAMTELLEPVVESVLGAFRFGLPDEDVASTLSYNLTRVMDVLALAGVVERIDVPAPDDTARWSRVVRGGSVQLTPAGVMAVRRRLIDKGFEAPEAGKYADHSAAELLAVTDDEPLAVVVRELQVWKSRRSPEAAAADLADAVVELDDVALKNLALGALGRLPAAAAVPEVRRIAEVPSVRGFARCWLVDHGHDDVATTYDPSDLSWFPDVLAHRLVMHGPDAMFEALALAGGDADQIVTINRMWRSPSTATTRILDHIGTDHPVKSVARTARKALFKRRSLNPQPSVW